MVASQNRFSISLISVLPIREDIDSDGDGDGDGDGRGGEEAEARGVVVARASFTGLCGFSSC